MSAFCNQTSVLCGHQVCPPPRKQDGHVQFFIRPQGGSTARFTACTPPQLKPGFLSKSPDAPQHGSCPCREGPRGAAVEGQRELLCCLPFSAFRRRCCIAESTTSSSRLQKTPLSCRLDPVGPNHSIAAALNICSSTRAQMKNAHMQSSLTTETQ